MTHVCARPADQDVITAAAHKCVVARGTTDNVVAAAAVDEVIPAKPIYDIIARGADYRVVARSTHMGDYYAVTADCVVTCESKVPVGKTGAWGRGISSRHKSPVPRLDGYGERLSHRAKIGTHYAITTEAAISVQSVKKRASVNCS